jgi:hypothetical protein
MIALKQLIKYDNANCLEATWVDIQPLSDIEHPEVPEQPALYDGDGNEVQAAVPAVPAWTESGRTQEVTIHCQAYSDEQIDLLREHAANYGTPLDDYEDLIQEVIDAHVPPVPPPLPVYTCSPWQIRKALNQLGSRDAVEQAVANSSDITLKDGWEFATEFRSDDSLVISMGVALGKNAQETAELIQFASFL